VPHEISKTRASSYNGATPSFLQHRAARRQRAFAKKRFYDFFHLAPCMCSRHGVFNTVVHALIFLYLRNIAASTLSAQPTMQHAVLNAYDVVLGHELLDLIRSLLLLLSNC
jgi:hypothetical protein